MQKCWRRGHAVTAALAVVAVGWLGLGCGLSSEEVYEVEGTVLDASSTARQITIAHDAIPGFMPAMTMNFDAAPSVDLDAIARGDRIRFSLERSATTLRVLAVVATGETAPVTAGASAATLPDDGPEIAPDFTLMDQARMPVSMRDLRGSVVLMDFIFTRCGGPCPILTSRHVGVQRDLDAELRACTRFVSVSIDPEYDRPTVLERYALERGVDLNGWSFLTGSTQQISDVLTQYGVGSVRVNAGRIDHLVVTFLIDREGRVERRYLGVADGGPQIVDDIRRLCS